MDLIKAMTMFTEVAECGSFAGAAKGLGVSTTSASRLVAELEDWLGATLFRRTTRRLSMTDEGANYLERCRQVLAEIDEIRLSASQALSRPTGTLRLTAPLFLAKECMRRVLPAFLDANPEVSVKLCALDRVVDLVDEGFDLALRIGDLPDSTLVARRLGDVRLAAVASPAYLAAYGEPKTLAALKQHNCIVDTVASFRERWPMQRSGRRQPVPVSGNAVVNNGELARDLAVQGVGLCLLPHFFVIDQLATGELVEVLKGRVDSEIGFFVVYPKSNHLPPKVRVFIDFFVDFFERRKAGR